MLPPLAPTNTAPSTRRRLISAADIRRCLKLVVPTDDLDPSDSGTNPPGGERSQAEEGHRTHRTHSLPIVLDFSRSPSSSLSSATASATATAPSRPTKFTNSAIAALSEGIAMMSVVSSPSTASSAPSSSADKTAHGKTGGRCGDLRVVKVRGCDLSERHLAELAHGLTHWLFHCNDSAQQQRGGSSIDQKTSRTGNATALGDADKEIGGGQDAPSPDSEERRLFIDIGNNPQIGIDALSSFLSSIARAAPKPASLGGTGNLRVAIACDLFGGVQETKAVVHALASRPPQQPPQPARQEDDSTSAGQRATSSSSSNMKQSNNGGETVSNKERRCDSGCDTASETASLDGDHDLDEIKPLWTPSEVAAKILAPIHDTGVELLSLAHMVQLGNENAALDVHSTNPNGDSNSSGIELSAEDVFAPDASVLLSALSTHAGLCGMCLSPPVVVGGPPPPPSGDDDTEDVLSQLQVPISCPPYPKRIADALHVAASRNECRNSWGTLGLSIAAAPSAAVAFVEACERWALEDLTSSSSVPAHQQSRNTGETPQHRDHVDSSTNMDVDPASRDDHQQSLSSSPRRSSPNSPLNATATPTQEGRSPQLAVMSPPVLYKQSWGLNPDVSPAEADAYIESHAADGSLCRGDGGTTTPTRHGVCGVGDHDERGSHLLISPFSLRGDNDGDGEEDTAAAALDPHDVLHDGGELDVASPALELPTNSTTDAKEEDHATSVPAVSETTPKQGQMYEYDAVSLSPMTTHVRKGLDLSSGDRTALQGRTTPNAAAQVKPEAEVAAPPAQVYVVGQGKQSSQSKSRSPESTVIDPPSDSSAPTAGGAGAGGVAEEEKPAAVPSQPQRRSSSEWQALKLRLPKRSASARAPDNSDHGSNHAALESHGESAAEEPPSSVAQEKPAGQERPHRRYTAAETKSPTRSPNRSPNRSPGHSAAASGNNSFAITSPDPVPRSPGSIPTPAPLSREVSRVRVSRQASGSRFEAVLSHDATPLLDADIPANPNTVDEIETGHDAEIHDRKHHQEDSNPCADSVNVDERQRHQEEQESPRSQPRSPGRKRDSSNRGGGRASHGHSSPQQSPHGQQDGHDGDDVHTPDQTNARRSGEHLLLTPFSLTESEDRQLLRDLKALDRAEAKMANCGPNRTEMSAHDDQDDGLDSTPIHHVDTPQRHHNGRDSGEHLLLTPFSLTEEDDRELLNDRQDERGPSSEARRERLDRDGRIDGHSVPVSSSREDANAEEDEVDHHSPDPTDPRKPPLRQAHQVPAQGLKSRHGRHDHEEKQERAAHGNMASAGTVPKDNTGPGSPGGPGGPKRAGSRGFARGQTSSSIDSRNSRISYGRVLSNDTIGAGDGEKRVAAETKRVSVPTATVRRSVQRQTLQPTMSRPRHHDMYGYGTEAAEYDDQQTLPSTGGDVDGYGYSHSTVAENAGHPQPFRRTREDIRTSSSMSVSIQRSSVTHGAGMAQHRRESAGKTAEQRHHRDGGHVDRQALQERYGGGVVLRQASTGQQHHQPLSQQGSTLRQGPSSSSRKENHSSEHDAEDNTVDAERDGRHAQRSDDVIDSTDRDDDEGAPSEAAAEEFFEDDQGEEDQYDGGYDNGDLLDRDTSTLIHERWMAGELPYQNGAFFAYDADPGGRDGLAAAGGGEGRRSNPKDGMADVRYAKFRTFVASARAEYLDANDQSPSAHVNAVARAGLRYSQRNDGSSVPTPAQRHAALRKVDSKPSASPTQAMCRVKEEFHRAHAATPMVASGAGPPFVVQKSVGSTSRTYSEGRASPMGTLASSYDRVDHHRGRGVAGKTAGALAEQTRASSPPPAAIQQHHQQYVVKRAPQRPSVAFESASSLAHIQRKQKEAAARAAADNAEDGDEDGGSGEKNADAISPFSADQHVSPEDLQTPEKVSLLFKALFPKEQRTTKALRSSSPHEATTDTNKDKTRTHTSSSTTKGNRSTSREVGSASRFAKHSDQKRRLGRSATPKKRSASRSVTPSAKAARSRTKASASTSKASQVSTHRGVRADPPAGSSSKRKKSASPAPSARSKSGGRKPTPTRARSPTTSTGKQNRPGTPPPTARGKSPSLRTRSPRSTAVPSKESSKTKAARAATPNESTTQRKTTPLASALAAGGQLRDETVRKGRKGSKSPARSTSPSTSKRSSSKTKRSTPKRATPKRSAARVASEHAGGQPVVSRFSSVSKRDDSVPSPVAAQPRRRRA